MNTKDSDFKISKKFPTNFTNSNSNIGIGIIRDNTDLNTEFNDNDFETLNEISE